jgi:general secretion pathway protein M
VTFAERLDKLEPRERRLLGILTGLVLVLLVLALPMYAWSAVRDARDGNDQVRDLISDIYKARMGVGELRAKQEALLARYSKPAPALAGFIEDAAKANNITLADSQDKPEVPHGTGKRYTERMTVVKLHKVGMLNLVKLLEKIEQSGHPVAISRLNIRPRSGEPDSYEVELGVSAYDRKADPKEKEKDKGEAKDAAQEEKIP